MKPTVFVVEDDTHSAQLVRAMLSKLGVHVQLARDAHETLKLLDQITPALIIMDLRLPGKLDGWQLIAQLRSRVDLAHLPIIVVSAYSAPSDIQRAQRAGCNDYIVKPLDMTSFLEVVRRNLAPYIST